MSFVTESLSLHRRSIVADLHCDTVSLFGSPAKFRFEETNKLGHIDLPRLQKGGVNLQFFAVFPGEEYLQCGAMQQSLKMIMNYHNAIERNSVKNILYKNDLTTAFADKSLASFLVLEGGEALEGEIKTLHCFYELGVRGMGLTWNKRNDLACGVGLGEVDAGLTDFGRRVVAEMNRLGMLIDAAHLAPRSYYEVLDCSSDPVIVSHANVKALCPHRRNLDNDQIKELQNQGGLIGLTFYPPFINGDNAAAPAELLDHFCYIADRFGTNIIAIGSDFDGIEKTVTGLEDVSCLPLLTCGLVERGFSEKEIKQILGGNVIDVMERVLKERGDSHV